MTMAVKSFESLRVIIFTLGTFLSVRSHYFFVLFVSCLPPVLNTIFLRVGTILLIFMLQCFVAIGAL